MVAKYEGVSLGAPPGSLEMPQGPQAFKFPLELRKCGDRKMFVRHPVNK